MTLPTVDKNGNDVRSVQDKPSHQSEQPEHQEEVARGEETEMECSYEEGDIGGEPFHQKEVAQGEETVIEHALHAEVEPRKLSSQMEAWRESFEARIAEFIKTAGPNRRWLTDGEYHKLKTFLTDPDTGLTNQQQKVIAAIANWKLRDNPPQAEVQLLKSKVKHAKAIMSKLKKWANDFMFSPGSNREIIISTTYDSLDKAIRVSYASNFFKDILECHTECGSHLSVGKTYRNSKRRHGRFINRELSRMFCEGCAMCAATRTISKPPAGTKPIVASEFLNRIQLDLVDMTGFVEGLNDAFTSLSSESQKKLVTMPKEWDASNIPKDSIPAYICNIGDHASKVGKSYPIPNKRPEQVALCLMDFMSTYGVPSVSKIQLVFLTFINDSLISCCRYLTKIIHTDNGGEFINMCYDEKYKKLRFATMTKAEFEQTKTIVSCI